MMIREATTTEDWDDCAALLRSLPDWFGIPSAIDDYRYDMERMLTWVIENDDGPVAFVTVNRHFPLSAEIHVMAVAAAFHRQGLGRRLVAHVERELSSLGVRFLQVKTVGPSSDNQPYAQTRLFYGAMGFVVLEEFPKLWSENNPCLLMVKTIG